MRCHFTADYCSHVQLLDSYSHMKGRNICFVDYISSILTVTISEDIPVENILGLSHYVYMLLVDA